MLGMLRRKRPVLLVDLTVDYLSRCADIHANSFSRGWSDGALHEMILSNGMFGIAAVQGSQGPAQTVLGFILYRAAAGECEIITIAIAPEHRRRGVAKSLIDEMIRRCLTDRLNEIFLEVDETNLAAIGLYRKLGFKEVGKRKAYYPSRDGEDTLSETEKPRTPVSIQSDGMALAQDAVIMRLDFKD